MKKLGPARNDTILRILKNAAVAAVALAANGFGVHLTIRAGIGAGPWDVFNLGLSKTLGILYGTASIAVSLSILVIDILLREPIGIAMFIDSVVVGKAVDLFDFLGFVPSPHNLVDSLLMMLLGLVIMGYTQFVYMRVALGCGPRDTLMVGLGRRARRIPIGVISMSILAVVTLIGYLLGGPVGVGTLVNALCAGPIMQFAFFTVGFDATQVDHQRLRDTAKIFKKRVLL